MNEQTWQRYCNNVRKLEKRVKALEQELTNIKSMLMKVNINSYTEGLKDSSEAYIEQFGPCDLCVFNPPSSTDGKPCTMCPAERKLE